MKNFLRALKFAWKYRYRLFLSIACAIAAAAFWSLNLTAVYPILKIFSSDQNLQTWVDEELKKADKQVDELESHLAHLKTARENLEGLPATEEKKRQERRLAKSIARAGDRLETVYRSRYYLHVARRFIYDYVPVDRFQTLILVISLVVLGMAMRGLFDFGQNYLVGSVVGLSLYDLRNRFYRNMLQLDVNRFGKTGNHEMMARFTNDAETLSIGMKTLFGKMVAEPLKVIGCVAVACWISWKLTVMFLILVPVALLILTKVSRLIKRASRRLLERMSNIYKLLQETFRGIRVVKAFTMEPYERRRFRNATREYYRKAMRVVMLDSMASPLIDLLASVAIAGALLVGAYLVLNQETHIWFGIRILDQPMETEALMQFYILLAAIADPVRRLSNVYTRLQSGAAAADRIFAYYDLKPRVQSNPSGPRLPRHCESIEFRDVCFSYSDPKNPALSNINLRVRYGETIALVGRNGSGKSTLVGLLPRFYDPDHGWIFIDGIDIREANLRSLRNQIGIVTQDTILFEDDTIYNNIAYGRRGATPEQVEQAARKALIHDTIMEMPQQYNTLAGEASGGQKQRIALARAILRDPSILILDEFTSQTDTVSEQDIHNALREFMQTRTTFLITHRMRTLELADRIVVLDQGRVVAIGSHQELMAGCPIYLSLHHAGMDRVA